ncbi:hypothetical protein E2493_20050 [Sphingomonas parva]|uniref:Uncharacterized protein n=1 Tax=Sphingomonas parva TaxID=2555898 RepID=A0A4Y8ZNS3_9SPHN|nr:hypothetical protein [Sphingomonas parva]TFI56459.1 hypothetical protein E2493_20050 [Sphingomonas parva]
MVDGSVAGFAAGLLLVCGLQSACSSEAARDETIETTARYDSAARQLTIGCSAATQGRCSVIVDNGGVQQTVEIAAGASTLVADVRPDARTCVLAARSQVANCAWVPVSQPG